MKAVTFEITTDASGDYDSTADGGVRSQPSHGVYLFYALEWVDTDFDAGVDAVLSVTNTPSGSDVTLITLTDADAEEWYYPRELECNNAGVVTDFYTPMVVAGTLKLVVSDGGNAKTGKAVVYLLEM